MLTGQSHASQGFTVQVPDPGAGGHLSANESRQLLSSSYKGPGASHAGQDTTACESSTLQLSAGHSVSLSEPTLLTQTSGLEYSQPGLGGRVLADHEVSPALTMTPLVQDHAAENQDFGLRLACLPWHRRMDGHRLPKEERNEGKNIEKASSGMETDALAECCDPGDTPVVALFQAWCSRSKRSKKGNEKKNTDKALPVMRKEDSCRVLSSGAACPSVAGLPAKTTRHAPDTQADAGASRIASGHPVTCSDETGEGAYLPRPRTRRVLRPKQLAALRTLFKSSVYPSQKEKEELAKRCDLEVDQVTSWFSVRRRLKCVSGTKRNKGKNAREALHVTPTRSSSRILSSRAACPSIAGLSVEATSHTPDRQAASSADRIAGNCPVTSSGETRTGGRLPRFRTRFSSQQIAEFLRLYDETGGYPDREQKNNLAASLGLVFDRVDMWFCNARNRDKRNILYGSKNATVFQMTAGLPAETTTSHTSGMQSASDASRIVGDCSVTLVNQTRPLRRFRYRENFSTQQHAELHALYNATEGFPSREQKDDLADKWGVKYSRINFWFGNLRSRIKKNGKEKNPDND